MCNVTDGTCGEGPTHVIMIIISFSTLQENSKSLTHRSVDVRPPTSNSKSFPGFFQLSSRSTRLNLQKHSGEHSVEMYIWLWYAWLKSDSQGHQDKSVFIPEKQDVEMYFKILNTSSFSLSIITKLAPLTIQSSLAFHQLSFLADSW